MQGLGLRVEDFGFRVASAGVHPSVSRIRVSGFGVGFRVSGLEF